MRLTLMTLPVILLSITTVCWSNNEIVKSKKPEALADQWAFLGEAINEPGWDIWGSSPIITDDGKVHLFVARWPGEIPFNKAWRTHSQIARYTADNPKGPFKFQEVVLKGDGEGWDAQGYHNPNIQKVGDRFALTCIANSGQGNMKGHPANQCIGIWVADTITGPWKPANGDPSKPMLSPPDDPAIWCYKSGCGVNNPALLPMSDRTFHLYFKALPGPKGHTRMGLAIADKLEGPYVIQPKQITANDRVIEDGYAFHWRGAVCLMTTDNHGMLERGGGLLWTSKDGKKFNKPLPGFHNLGKHYFPDGVPKNAKGHYTKQHKCERPQILMIDGEPRYLYAPSGTALDGSDGTNCYLFSCKVKNDSAATLPPLSPIQVAQRNRGYGMFIHFGVNTFNQTEWSNGKLPVDSYHPTELDCDQWIRIAKEAGFRYVILITKHHDGFCLWNSAHTKYDVAASPVKTDIVAEVAKACRKYGLELGLYYSLWDRNHPSHADPDPTIYQDYMKI